MLNPIDMPDVKPLEFPDFPDDKLINCPACDIWGLNSQKLQKMNIL